MRSRPKCLVLSLIFPLMLFDAVIKVVLYFAHSVVLNSVPKDARVNKVILDVVLNIVLKSILKYLSKVVVIFVM